MRAYSANWQSTSTTVQPAPAFVHDRGDEQEARIEPFDAITLDVASWWL